MICHFPELGFDFQTCTEMLHVNPESVFWAKQQTLNLSFWAKQQALTFLLGQTTTFLQLN